MTAKIDETDPRSRVQALTLDVGQIVLDGFKNAHEAGAPRLGFVLVVVEAESGAMSYTASVKADQTAKLLSAVQAELRRQEGGPGEGQKG